ncbi:MAG TPA: hypothetical protein VKD88_07685 [Gaiellaceae bacterium]|jgi:hypothetical protein|nr:hypothetical protein [Gaiellaceae bacterium]
MAFLRMRRRRRRTRPLAEAEAYARCHGDRGNDVKVVRLPPRRPRYLAILHTGEELRQRFEERLNARAS